MVAKKIQHTELFMQKKSQVKHTDICKCEVDECQNRATHYDSYPDEFEEGRDIGDD